MLEKTPTPPEKFLEEKVGVINEKSFRLLKTCCSDENSRINS